MGSAFFSPRIAPNAASALNFAPERFLVAVTALPLPQRLRRNLNLLGGLNFGVHYTVRLRILRNHQAIQKLPYRHQPSSRPVRWSELTGRRAERPFLAGEGKARNYSCRVLLAVSA